MEVKRLPGPTRAEFTDSEFGYGVHFLVEDAILRNKTVLSQKPIDPVKQKELELASRLFLGKPIISNNELNDVLTRIKKDYTKGMLSNTSEGFFNALMSGFDYYLLTGLPITDHAVLLKLEASSVDHIKSKYVDLFIGQHEGYEDNPENFYIDNIDEIVDLGLGLRIVDIQELRLVKSKVLEALLKYVELRDPSVELKGKESLRYLKVMSTIIYLESLAVLHSEQGKTKLITKEHNFS